MSIIFIDCPYKSKENIDMDIGISQTIARREDTPRDKLKTFDEVMRSFGWIIFLTDIEHFGDSEVNRYVNKFNL